MAGSLLELKFGILDGPGPAIEFLFWKQGEQAFLSQIVAGSYFGAQISNLEICFLSTVGRHSLFWKVPFTHFRAAQPVLEAAF